MIAAGSNFRSRLTRSMVKVVTIPRMVMLCRLAGPPLFLLSWVPSPRTETAQHLATVTQLAAAMMLCW
jgi:hypothetical protein